MKNPALIVLIMITVTAHQRSQSHCELDFILTPTVNCASKSIYDKISIRTRKVFQLHPYKTRHVGTRHKYEETLDK